VTHESSAVGKWKWQSIVQAMLLVAIAAGCARVAVGATRPKPVRSGMEVLLSDSLHLVRGKRVGLVTNLAALGSNGTDVVTLMRAAPVTLVALFGPEHGLTAQAAPGERVGNAVDSATRIPIYSLYGAIRRPTPEMLAGIEVLVVDLPDVGARYYTYISTTVEVMQAAAQAGIPVIVADRPNPIGGTVQGSVRSADTVWSSMVSRLVVPLRHGLTLGEQALLAVNELGINVRLSVVPALGWRRNVYYESTGLPFRAPSPNLKDVDALFHYAGTCLFEGTALSVGRGTDFPFHQVGAPWLDTTAVLQKMWAANLPGVGFVGTSFTPRNPGDAKFADTTVVGIRLVISDRTTYDPTATAVHLLAAIRDVHPDRIRIGGSFDRLSGGRDLREALLRGERPEAIVSSWQSGVEAFRERVRGMLLYP
jgi:uncharacterized protein YbbC (DUF1343 family)